MTKKDSGKHTYVCVFFGLSIAGVILSTRSVLSLCSRSLRMLTCHRSSWQ